MLTHVCVNVADRAELLEVLLFEVSSGLDFAQLAAPNADPCALLVCARTEFLA